MVKWLCSIWLTLFFGQILFAQEDAVEIKSQDLDTIVSSTKDENPEPLQKKLSSMSLEQKVGQLLILGFSGTQLNSNIKKTMDTMSPGAMILFKHNIKNLTQTANLNHNLQSYGKSRTRLPLFIMIDQEGGQVARVKTDPPLPTALAMGNSANSELVKNLGRHMGELLHTLGFNMNLAPVLDIADPSRRSFIGNRSFGGEPNKVGEMALAFSRGLNAALVIPTAKHFPGHGGLSQDSHKKTPTKLLNLEELDARDLVPFKAYAEMKGPSALMVAHVAYPNIDPTGMPAAFSETIIKEVLRHKLRYQGLVITDDIEMLGADLAGSIEERAIKAIEAGCDMVMIAWSPQRQIRAYSGLLKAVKSGRISEARLNESVQRILKAKNFINTEAVSQQAELKIKIKQQMAALALVTKQITYANFKQGQAAMQPSPTPISQEQKLIVFSSDPIFYSQFLAAQPKNKIKYLKLTPRTLPSVELFLAKNPDWFGVYFASGSITARQLNSFSREIKQRLIVINGAYPGAIEGREHFHLILDVNTPDPESGRWLAENFIEGTLAPLKDLPADIRDPASKQTEPDDQASR